MSLMSMTPTTELEAVNTIISIIGESPINSLSDEHTHDITVAINVLKEISVETQTDGWNWNTEDEYPLVPNLDKQIVLPSNVTRVHFRNTNDGRDIIQRGQKLYDRANHTDRFDDTLYATITLLLPFEDLPEAARRYVVLKAGRVFQERTVGAGNLHDFNTADEARARAAIMADERKSDRPNLLNGTMQRPKPWSPYNVVNRRRA